ncbi:hypothetical protein M407DRAFT_25991 [Tulasnella calospora MUT 4182]|uniref:Uncharacterized protein n=1 Tax=Tulasnella calospora MUT 4182 TaxID=1051891 RepID=A0A0C3Q605_9AGAM|nr:hypothetical protein M407DRAFT_25991 [Tulasnella calospora MUT 4182]
MGQALSSARSFISSSPPKPAKKRAGSRATKPLQTLDTSAASLPLDAPKSPRGAPISSTNPVNSTPGIISAAVLKAKAEERKGRSGTNRSGGDSQNSSCNPTPNNSPPSKRTGHETGKNAGATNLQNTRSTSGATSPQVHVIPPFQSATEEAKHKFQAERQERHAKSGSGTNRSGHDSQPSSRNPAPSNSPESKSAKLGTGKNAGVSSGQNKQSVSDTTSPTTSPETPTKSPGLLAKLLSGLKFGLGTKSSGHESQHSSRNPTPSNSPEGKPIGLGMGKNAERHNKPSTSDTTNPAPSAESISSPDNQSPSGDIKDSPQGKSTELGGTQTNIQPSTLPTQTLPPKSGNPSRHTTNGALRRISSHPNLEWGRRQRNNQPPTLPTQTARRRISSFPSLEGRRTERNNQPPTLPTQTHPPKSGNPSPHTTDEHLNRKGANPNLDHK